MATSFIGVDLAWQAGRHSGLAAFRGDARGAAPLAFGTGATDLDAVAAFILTSQAETTVVAIDASLIITNREGQRPCEREITRDFGRAHAGAYPTNLTLYPHAAGVALADRLRARGFRHCTPPDQPWNPEGEWFFEVYPHPAQVVLFERDRIIRYKKGRIAERKTGLQTLRSEIRTRLIAPDLLRPSVDLLAFLNRDLRNLGGTNLKQYEDGLDALISAYLAFHLWHWAWQRSKLYGDMETGYIVVPSVPARARPLP